MQVLLLELIQDKTEAEIWATQCPFKDFAGNNQISLHTKFSFLPFCCKSSMFVFIHEISAADWQQKREQFPLQGKVIWKLEAGYKFPYLDTFLTR